jgi:hypothetical protein
MRSRAREVALSIALAALALGLALGLGEAAVRVFAPQHPSWLPIYRLHPEIPAHALVPNIDSMIEAGDGAYRVKTDADGWRVGEAAARADRAALWVIGDSYVFGQGVSFEDSFVGQLAALPGLRLQPLNFGVGGYGPRQYRLLLEHELARRPAPALVLVGFYVGNDFMDAVIEKRFSVRDGILDNPGTPRAWAKRNLHVYRLVSNALHRLAPGRELEELEARGAVPPEAEARAREVVAREFAAMREACAARGVPLGVVLIPTQTATRALRGEDAGALRGDPLRPMQIASEICAELGLRCLDLTREIAALPTREAYLAVDGHFAPRAGAVAARAIARAFPELTP